MTETPSPPPAEQPLIQFEAQPRFSEGRHADDQPLRRFLRDHRPAVGSLTVFVLMLAAFFIGSPAVFSQWSIYRAVLTGLPVLLFVVVPLVFIVTVREIDLSFPATMAMVTQPQSTSYKILAGDLYGLPVQILRAVLFIVFCSVLYNRQRFGARVHVVGDNPDAAQQMGIDTRRVRMNTYVFVGIGSAPGGVFGVLINFTWYPASGDGYLLPALASVFVGGTAPWGGVGTVIGSAIRALNVSFIQTGMVGAGLSGFYVHFFYGLIIILSLLGHRWNQIRYR